MSGSGDVMMENKNDDDGIVEVKEMKESSGNRREEKLLLSDVRAYVFFYWISHSHLFNKLDIHTTFMYTHIYPLFLVTHSLIHMIHTLNEAIVHTYVTLEPQDLDGLRSGTFLFFF